MHIKDDFVAGAPVSQIPAAVINSIAKFCNSIIGGVGVTFNKHDDGSPSVIEVELSREMGTPVDNRSASTVANPVQSTMTFANWTSGGADGLKIRVYALVDDTGGVHEFQPLDIEIAANGIVKSVIQPSGAHGIIVGA